jgi:hypothetical protein
MVDADAWSCLGSDHRRECTSVLIREATQARISVSTSAFSTDVNTWGEAAAHRAFFNRPRAADASSGERKLPRTRIPHLRHRVRVLTHLLREAAIFGDAVGEQESYRQTIQRFVFSTSGYSRLDSCRPPTGLKPVPGSRGPLCIRLRFACRLRIVAISRKPPCAKVRCDSTPPRSPEIREGFGVGMRQAIPGSRCSRGCGLVEK